MIHDLSWYHPFSPEFEDVAQVPPKIRCLRCAPAAHQAPGPSRCNEAVLSESEMLHGRGRDMPEAASCVWRQRIETSSHTKP